MRNRYAKFITGVLFICVFAISHSCEIPTPKTGRELETQNHPKPKNKKISYTKHARCRMECRMVSESEVEDILENGRINRSKSDPADKPCPTEALEGRSADGQQLRVVVARCEETDKIVTVIDLETDFTCTCN